MRKTRVAVLRGGPSNEYDVSLRTGQSVITALSNDRYTIIDVVITRGGEWLVGGFVRFPEHVLQMVDVVFLALHGAYGEDGTVQRLLDRFCVKYTGSGAYASSVAMHKALTKDMLRESGINMAPHMVVTADSKGSTHKIASSISEMFGPQYVIKPVSSGSSVGTMMVKDSSLLSRALEDALTHYDEVIVEKRIIGREATCGVVENYRNELLYALPPIEIVPPAQSEFFDYTVKYDGRTEEICPGRFPHAQKREIESLAKKVHQQIGLSQYSRADFMITDDAIYFLEVNTLPGLSSESLFPKAISAVGGTYEQFIEHLITDALNRKR